MKFVMMKGNEMVTVKIQKGVKPYGGKRLQYLREIISDDHHIYILLNRNITATWGGAEVTYEDYEVEGPPQEADRVIEDRRKKL